MKWSCIMLAWVAAACGDDGDGGGGGGSVDGVTCSAGTPIGNVTYSEISASSMHGDRVTIVGGYDASRNGRNVLVVDAATREAVAEWMWEWSGELVGPTMSPGVLTEPGTTFRPVDPATGAMGAGVTLSSSNIALGDTRVIGTETHLGDAVHHQHVVLDPSGALLRVTELPPGMSSTPVSSTIALLDDALVALGTWRVSPAYIKLRRWDHAGMLVAERQYTADELGMADVEGTAVVRAGGGAVLVKPFPDRVEMQCIDAQLALGPAIVQPSTVYTDRELQPQAGGITIGWTRREETRFSAFGFHLAGDDTITPFEVQCTHDFVAPGGGISVPRDAPGPTWVFNVGNTAWMVAL